jgi:hypothetical protein
LTDEDSSKDTAKEVRQGLGAILERIADFFDIFDLSFFVSGATTFAALGFWASRTGLAIPASMPSWLQVTTFVISSYVFGLVCFAVARWPNRYFRWGRTEGGERDRLLAILRGHGLLEVPTIASYLSRADVGGESRLYVRLWADVRQSAALAPSYSLLRRYWVMSATYDGLMVAIGVWVAVIGCLMFGLGGAERVDPRLGSIAILALLVSAWACWREATRNLDNQIDELVATVAEKKQVEPRH